jgi:hypothetical protein
LDYLPDGRRTNAGSIWLVGRLQLLAKPCLILRQGRQHWVSDGITHSSNRQGDDEDGFFTKTLTESMPGMDGSSMAFSRDAVKGTAARPESSWNMKEKMLCSRRQNEVPRDEMPSQGQSGYRVGSLPYAKELLLLRS